MPQGKRTEPERRPSVTATRSAQRTEPERRPSVTATRSTQKKDPNGKKEREK